MTLPKLRLKNIEKFAVDNSPVILTVIGVVGTVGTAILTHKAAIKSDTLLRLEMEERARTFENADRIHERNAAHRNLEMTKRERFDLVWTVYIPPAVSCVATVGAIVMANRIGSKRAAAIAAAYTIMEKASSEYQAKVVEKFGEQKERNMREELAQDQVNRNPMNESNVVVVGTGDVLCCDLFSGRYFRSSVEELKKAQNDTNHEILNYGYASLTDFYDRIGIPRTDVSDEVGWNQDKLLELEFSATINEEGQPCVAYRFQVHPVRGFFKLHP